LKQLFYFKNSEFKFIGYRFCFLAIFLLLFYNGTYGHDRDEVVNNQTAATYNTASKISVLNAREKAEVYSRDFLTVSSAYGLIFQKRVRNRAYNIFDKYFKKAMKGT
jgi:hypothetical protein